MVLETKTCMEKQMTPKRIKEAANKYTKDEGYQKVYIAGATAEHDRAKGLADALGEVESIHKQYYNLNGDNPAANHLLNIVRQALEQWKGKEVEP